MKDVRVTKQVTATSSNFHFLNILAAKGSFGVIIFRWEAKQFLRMLQSNYSLIYLFFPFSYHFYVLISTHFNKMTTIRSELLQALELRLTALKEDMVTSLNRAAGSHLSTKHISDLIAFSQHFGAMELRYLFPPWQCYSLEKFCNKWNVNM